MRGRGRIPRSTSGEDRGHQEERARALSVGTTVAPGQAGHYLRHSFTHSFIHPPSNRLSIQLIHIVCF